MSGQWGQNLRVSIFGESHGAGIGIVIDGLPSGLAVDWDEVARELKRRAPGQNAMSTTRKEADAPKILSGVFNGYTTGTPLCAVIENTNTRSGDYADLNDTVRPGHADYPGAVRTDVQQCANDPPSAPNRSARQPCGSYWPAAVQ